MSNTNINPTEKIADQLLVSNILHILENEDIAMQIGIGANDLKQLAKKVRSILKKDVKLEEYVSEKSKLKK